MHEIIPNVYTFSGLMVGRVYALEDADGLTVIDASIPNAGAKILKQLQAAGRTPGDVKRILITHAHPDHAGSLPMLKRETGAAVYVHPVERPVVESGAPIARAPAESLSLPWRAVQMPDTRLPPTPVDHTVTEDDVLPILGGLHVVESPGHAPGHVAFWSPSRRLLIVGDVFFHVLGVRPPLPMFTADHRQNARSAHKLAELPAEIVLFGHGQPILTGGQAKLKASLHRFKM